MTALRDARQERGWSQMKLAAEAGVDQATVSRIEKGGDFYVSVLRKLARALGVSADKIVGGE